MHRAADVARTTQRWSRSPLDPIGRQRAFTYNEKRVAPAFSRGVARTRAPRIAQELAQIVVDKVATYNPLRRGHQPQSGTHDEATRPGPARDYFLLAFT